MSWQQGFLVALIAVPAVGCLVAALAPARRAVATGIATAAVTFLAAGALLLDLLHRHLPTAAHAPVRPLPPAPRGSTVVYAIEHVPDRTLRVDLPWLRGIGVRFHVLLDGISAPLVVLTALLTLLCLIYTARRLPEPGRPRAFVALVLLLQVGMLGTFLAADLLLFFVFFEIVLVPMYFLIGIWGGSERKGYAATKFILYTLLGSAFLLIGFLGLYFGSGAHTFDMTTLANARGAGMSHHLQEAVFAALLIGFGIKTPMWPLHTWLPDAHTEAPTVGSVLLAGVLLKMGTYGFIRIALPMAPHGAHDFAPYVGAVAAVGIVYGSLVCLAQRELKRLIAYSSVGHMGFVLLGIATLTPTGVNAALYGNIAHGLITGLLFFLVGSLKDRYHTDALADIGGGALVKVPRIAGLLAFAAIASLGLPGLAGFWGEMLSLLAAYHPAAGLSRPLFWAYLAAGGVGTVLTAGYFLLLLLRVNLGVVPERWRAARLGDAGLVELAAWAPLVVLIVAVGCYPRLVLGITDSAVRALAGGAP